MVSDNTLLSDIMKSNTDTLVMGTESTSISTARLSQNTKDYISASRAENTIKAYRNDWANFVSFCEQCRHLALPASPETVADFLSFLAVTKRVATIQRHIASISVAHKSANLQTPTSSEIVRLTMAGIRRTLGCAQTRKAPIRVRDIRTIVAYMGLDVRSIRDRALLLTSYGGALRRSEVVALSYDDVRIVPEGIVLTLRRSKGDQFGLGAEVAIMRGHREETCPVKAVEHWLAISGIVEGALFRPIIGNCFVGEQALSDRGVARIFKRLAFSAGLDPSNISGHSCRAGLVTDAFLAGVAQAVIGKHSRHRPGSAALSAYLREDQFKSNPSGLVGL